MITVPLTVPLTEIVGGLRFPEGPLALPDGGLLFVECWRGTLSRWDAAHGYRIVANLGGRPAGICGFDSLGVDSEGFIAVATVGSGCLTVVAPEGSSWQQIDVGDRHVTNICWGGPDLRTAYVTIGGSGRIVSLPWERPGLALNFLDR